MPIFKLTNVVVEGEHQRRLDAVSIEVCHGITAIIGFSGAGKTSLLNLLAGFEAASSGTVEGHIESKNDRLDRFWVPQNDGLWPQCTVAEHVECVSCSGKGRELLQAFGLSSLANRRPEGLSRGERSRLSVARALASEAAVLIMDEPLSHVDPAREADYWRVVREWCREHGSTLIFATHSPEQVLREAEHVICLDDGRVVYSGEVAELYYSPPTHRLAEFLGACNWFDHDVAKRLFALELESHSVRPERLLIQPSEDGKLVVVDSVFVGSVCNVKVQESESGVTHMLKCRPPGKQFEPGNCVRLEIRS